MKQSNKPGISSIIAALAQLGLEEVIICPGSRNAPLVISFNRHPKFHCTSIRDERSAAFFALGKSVTLNKPVAIVCTSGSAGLNFAPAISEAYYQRIPLIVITADRPKEWTGQGDGQTINQTNLYQNFIRRSYELKGDAMTTADFWYNERSICEGYSIATVSDRGPVHFNIPLSEPLYNAAEAGMSEPKVFRLLQTETVPDRQSVGELSTEFSASRRVMILAGQHLHNPALQSELSEMALFENVIVLTESTSNIHDRYFVENIDRCITGMSDEEGKSYAPDLLITIGGAVVSKRIKALLRKFRPKYHWNVNPFDATMDTYQSLTHAIAMEPAAFFARLRPSLPHEKGEYRSLWLDRKKHAAAAHEKFCASCEYSDLKAFYKLYSYIDPGTILHLANSSPIRYAQLFDNSCIEATWSNRGTSGIDGCTSTAIGAASSMPWKKFLLITGDVAFYYDINALWNEEAISNLNIILINNGGGGIFRIISGPDKVDELERFFETSMQSNAKKIAENAKWNYLSARDDQSLAEAMNTLFKPDATRTILEIFTDAETNPLVLENYWKYLKENQS